VSAGWVSPSSILFHRWKPFRVCSNVSLHAPLLQSLARAHAHSSTVMRGGGGRKKKKKNGAGDDMMFTRPFRDFFLNHHRARPGGYPPVAAREEEKRVGGPLRYVAAALFCLPTQDCGPYAGIHVRRESVGAVPCSRAILCQPVTNPNRPLRKFHIAARRTWMKSLKEATSIVKAASAADPCEHAQQYV
jgi:hypothetical protein